MSSGICSCFNGWTGLECADVVSIQRNSRMSQQLLPSASHSKITQGEEKWILGIN